MAPFDSSYSSNLKNKLSPLIEGQVPDFIQADHAVFVRFLKHYYEYLESGELQVSVTIDNLLLELETTSFVLDVDGDKVVLENGTDETTGKFVVGETITGATSKATATILVDDLGNSTPRIFITGQQQFQTGETITGGTSNATGTVVRYRANPVQNIQQLLEYANVDNTIYDFLDQLRDSFMNAIPKELASGVNKRNLIKNIRELYRAKGTSEGHKIFMRMLLDENIEVVYPNKFMMRASDGKWSDKTILRCSPGANAVASEMVGVVITGQSSGATAVVAGALTTAEGGDSIVQFEINPESLVGTFTDGETIQGISTVQDVTMSFTVRGIVTNYTITDGGKLYSVGDDLDLDTQTAIGNGEALAEVASIKRGSVSRVIIDNAGTLYREGDTLTFTTTETNTKAASGFVSVIDGSLEIDGTDISGSDAGDNLVLESSTTSSIVHSNLLLDGTDASSTNAGDKLSLDGTNSSSHNAGHFFNVEGEGQITLDSYGTDNDTFALEDGTVSTGEITRIFLKDGGGGYSSLPTVTSNITGGNTASGLNALLTADTNDIGAADSVNITRQGFKYTEAPEGRFRANFILKDVTGTFAATNTLTSAGHTGVIKDWNSTTKVLKTTFEDVQRITMETGASEGIELEQFLFVATDRDDKGDFLADNHFATDDQLVDQDGNNIVMDSPFEGKQLDYFVIEDGTDNNSDGFLVEEDSRIGVDSGIALESVSGGNNLGDTIPPVGGRGLYDNLVYEDILGGVIGYEDATSVNDARYFDPNSTQTRFVTENSLSIATRTDAGDNILLNGDIEFGHQNEIKIILDGTDSSGSDAGDNLVTEATSINKNRIVLDGTDTSSTDAGSALLNDIEILSGNIALNGTNSSSNHADDNIINEEPPDFSAEGTTITDSGGASGTIVSADIAKGTTSIGTKVVTIPSYGVSIESLIGEDLNRIQDSVYYQQFSYEIETASSSADYLTELKKAVHPAGFNVFSKVSIATQVSAALPTVGSSLGGGYTSDTDTFSPVLASTFNIIFQEEVKRRSTAIEYSFSSFDDEILLEDNNFTELGTVFSIENEVGGDDTIILEDSLNPIAFAGDIISLENGLGQIIVEESLSSLDIGNRIISESGVEVTHDLLLEPETNTMNGKLVTGVSFTHSAFLLDGTNSVSSDAGDRIIVEDAPSAKLLAEPIGDNNVLVNEDGGSQHLETAGKGDASDKEVGVISQVTTKIMLPRKQASSLPSGLITMAEKPFGPATGTISLEMGIVGGGGSGSLLITGFEQINELGNVNTVSEIGEQFLLEDATDDNIGTGFTFENFGSYSQDTIVLDGTDSSSSNAGDNILINNIGDPDNSPMYLVLNTAADESENILTEGGELLRVEDELERLNLSGNLLGEHSFNYPFMTIDDIIRQARFDVGDASGETFNLIAEDSGTIGNFKQEDGTTVTGTYGDDIMLESGVGVGYGNKLALESSVFIIPEDEVRNNTTHGFDLKGIIPSENYTNSDVEPFTYSSDIITRPMDILVLEDQGFESTNVQLETGTTNGEFANLLNDATSTDSDGVAIDDGSTIALEDHFDIRGGSHGGAKFLLNRTAASGDFTNIGEQVLLESATFYETIDKTSKVNLPQTFENTFDSTSKTFDSSNLTFDSLG